MRDEVELRCDCGKISGAMHIEPNDPARRLRCYCDDCQAFQHFLKRGGDILDVHGGTDIIQLSPSALRLDKGLDQLRCVRLTPKGVARWYAGCCKTPIGNTLPTPQLPFVGLIEHAVRDRAWLDHNLGTSRLAVFGSFARGDRSALNAHDKLPISMMLGAIWRIARRRLAGAHKKSPFFDPTTGAPRAEATVLSAAEREALL